MMIRSASIKGIRQLCEESVKLITNENKESKYLFLCSIHLQHYLSIDLVQYYAHDSSCYSIQFGYYSKTNLATIKRYDLYIQIFGISNTTISSYMYQEDPLLYCDLYFFIDMNEADSDLFNCFTHLQLHRRARGLRRLQKIIKLYVNEDLEIEDTEERIKESIQNEEKEIEEEEDVEMNDSDSDSDSENEEMDEDNMTDLMKEAFEVVDDEKDLDPVEEEEDEEDEKKKEEEKEKMKKEGRIVLNPKKKKKRHTEENEDKEDWSRYYIDNNTIQLLNNARIDRTKPLFNDETISTILVPLLLHFIEDSNKQAGILRMDILGNDLDQEIITEGINTLGYIFRLMNWSQAYRLVNRFMHKVYRE